MGVAVDEGSQLQRVEDQSNLLKLGVDAAPGELVRFDYVTGTVSVPAVLRVSRRFPHRLAVLTNGAVKRDSGKSPREVFQRRKWIEEIDASVLLMSDPTLSPDNRLSIGWGQGSPGAFALPAMAQAVQAVARELDVAASSRLYYGSSAGGFQALYLGAMDSGSRVLVNNPQTDWTNYLPSAVRAVLRYSYGGRSVQEVKEDFSERVSIPESFRFYSHIPRVRYLVNAASRSDFSKDLTHFMDGIPKLGGRSTHHRLEVSIYSAPQLGHNPLPKADTLTEINDSLELLT